MKIKFVTFVFLFIPIIGSLWGIEYKDYSQMTERDRILLSVSYYEVGVYYKKNGDAKLSDTYFNEASKIEPKVEKYYSQELEIPKKSITFDWDEIFKDTDATTDSASTGSDTVSANENAEDGCAVLDDVKSVTINEPLLLWDSFILSVKENKLDNLSMYFSENILMYDSDIFISIDELKESIIGWLNDTSKSVGVYNAEKLDSTVLKIVFDNGDFFFPVEANTLYMRYVERKDTLVFDAVSAKGFAVK